MKIEQITVGPFEVNCCVVWNDAKQAARPVARQAIIIDPGYDAQLITSCLDANGLTVAAYLLTHGHADHINALAELHAEHPSPVYLHKEDEKWAFGEHNQIAPYYPVPKKPDADILHPENPPRPAGTPPTEGIDKVPLHGRGGRNDLSAVALAKAEVTDGVGSNDWKLTASGPADFSKHWKNLTQKFQGLEIVETPGHTRGGVCYWFKEENVCFTGDTLFKGSCGRTDLPGGDGRVLAQSLKKLAGLPPETKVIAGHGDETTIAHELKTNFFLQSH